MLYTYLHNSLVTESEIDRTSIMQKIVYYNEKDKTYKTILDETIYLAITLRRKYLQQLVNLIVPSKLRRPSEINYNLNELESVIYKFTENVEQDLQNLSINIKEIKNMAIFEEN